MRSLISCSSLLFLASGSFTAALAATPSSSSDQAVLPYTAHLANLPLNPGEQRRYRVDYEDLELAGGTRTVPRIMSVSPLVGAGEVVMTFQDADGGELYCQRTVTADTGATCNFEVAPGAHRQMQVTLQGDSQATVVGSISHTATLGQHLYRIHPQNGIAVDQNPLREPADHLHGEITLSGPTTLDVHTWGGQGRITLSVASLTAPDTARQCTVQGGLWQHCRLVDAPAGKYVIYLQGDVGEVNLMARW